MIKVKAIPYDIDTKLAIAADTLAGSGAGGFRFKSSDNKPWMAVDVSAVRDFLNDTASGLFAQEVLSTEAKLLNDAKIAVTLAKIEGFYEGVRNEEIKKGNKDAKVKWTRKDIAKPLPEVAHKATMQQIRRAYARWQKLTSASQLTESAREPVRTMYLPMKAGCLCFVNNEAGTLATARQEELLLTLLHALDDELANQPYRIVQQTDAALPDAKPAQTPLQVASSKPPKPLDALRRMSPTELLSQIRAGQSRNFVTKANFTPDVGLGQYFELLRPCPSRIYSDVATIDPTIAKEDKATLLQQDKAGGWILNKGSGQNFPPALWIPNVRVDSLVEVEDSAKIYCFKSDVFWAWEYPKRRAAAEKLAQAMGGGAQPAAAPVAPATAPPGAQPAPAPGKNPAGDKDDSCAYVVNAGGELISLPYIQTEETGGGGGAMRSDRPNEAEYFWSGNKALGYALELDPERYRPGEKPSKKKTLGYRSPLPAKPGVSGGLGETSDTRLVGMAVAGSMSSEIIYWKRFARKPAAKKNLPEDTKPLPPRRFDRKAASSKAVKKQKGDWKFSPSSASKQAIAIGAKKIGERDDAGMVMGTILAQLGLIVSGLDLGSATSLAGYAVGPNDSKASEAWKALSKTLTTWNDNAASDSAKKAVRTAQEWCHLLGHGDGGVEDYGNFISGSKHCNTEQLAIETGQRSGQRAFKVPLAVKVSAYLFPSNGFAKKRSRFADWEIRFFLQFPEVAQLCDSKGNFDQVKAFAKLAEIQKTVGIYLQAWQTVTVMKGSKPPGPDSIVARLPIKPQGKSEPGRLNVPTGAEFKKLDDAHKIKVCINLFAELRNIIELPYPVGDFVRYKIYNVAGSAPVKIFDHVFDAQEESFDYNEFKIVEATVRRVVAASIGLAQPDLDDEEQEATPTDATRLYEASMNAKIALRRQREAREQAVKKATQPQPPATPTPTTAKEKKKEKQKEKAERNAKKKRKNKETTADGGSSASAMDKREDGPKPYSYWIGGWSGPGDGQ
ncbi:MAG: hypothetical protein JO339_09905 [Alphaproteobacteria bacterium]|nr:hypothetical protein [Alphaproteobacteria bacterium]